MFDTEVIFSDEVRTICIKTLVLNTEVSLCNMVMFAWVVQHPASILHCYCSYLNDLIIDNSSDTSNDLPAVSVHTSGHLVFYFAAREGWGDTPAQFSERSGSESRGKRDWVSQTTSAGTTEHNRRSVQGINISSHMDAQKNILKATIRLGVKWYGVSLKKGIIRALLFSDQSGLISRCWKPLDTWRMW